jgi:hypothetical protein
MQTILIRRTLTYDSISCRTFMKNQSEVDGSRLNPKLFFTLARKDVANFVKVVGIGCWGALTLSATDRGL